MQRIAPDGGTAFGRVEADLWYEERKIHKQKFSWLPYKHKDLDLSDLTMSAL